MSRFGRTTVWLPTGTSSRKWANLPKPPRWTVNPKYRSDSARAKLSTVTRTGAPASTWAYALSAAAASMAQAAACKDFTDLFILPLRVVMNLVCVLPLRLREGWGECRRITTTA
ncbi:hypothetical protein D3C81_1940580 [compost metagenome]